MISPTAAALGEIGLPTPLRELAAKTWDVIVVGAGHNGLACAAYLAQAGLQVLVIESRSRVGGACTIEEPFPGVRMSPCAYLAGLLHPLVIEELDLPRRGFRWTPAVNGLFVPFLDGTSIQLWDDDQRCLDEVRRLSPGDVRGFEAMSDVVRRLRDALRPRSPDSGNEPGRPVDSSARDVWVGEAPTRDWIEERLAKDDEARSLLFDWSMAEFVERYLKDERLQVAYLGQGVIGTNASPFDKGTASIRFHHASGRLGGMPGMWGYVQGGMGMVSFYFCDAAREAGATVVSGVAVAQVLPGEGVVLEGGERIAAGVVVSNADPRVTLRLLGDAAEVAWRKKIEEIPIEGCTVKLNVHLRELPDFTARPGTNEPHHYGQINAPLTKDEWKAGFAAARRGELPEHLWCELYFQSVHDAIGGAARDAHDERVCAVCPLQVCAGDVGRAAGRSAHIGPQFPCPILLEYRRGWDGRGHRRAGAGAAGHREKSGPDGRTYFSGRVSAAVHVVQSAGCADADAGDVSLWRMHTSGRQRDRDQWTERCDGGADGSGQDLASHAPRALVCSDEHDTGSSA